LCCGLTLLHLFSFGCGGGADGDGGSGGSGAASSSGGAPVELETSDVSYDPSAPEDPLRTLDIYPLPSSTTAAPVVIWVHGGGWHSGDKENKMARKVELFNGEGYLLVSLNYRLSPEPKASPDPDRIRFPTHPEDVARAVAWVHANAASYGGDPERIALLGHSAGAHLVALLGTAPAYLAPYDLAPTDLRCVGSFDTEGYDVPSAIETGSAQQNAVLINAFGTDPAVWTEASPLTHVALGVPDFLLVARGAAPRRASVEAFRAALADVSVPADVIEAAALEHDEVSEVIGEPDDQIMTPAIRTFLEGCFE
jgi:acetyl esterase/lipase